MGDVLIPTAEHICSVPSVDFEKPLSYFRSRIEELRTSEVRLFHCMFAERLIVRGFLVHLLSYIFILIFSKLSISVHTWCILSYILLYVLILLLNQLSISIHTWYIFCHTLCVHCVVVSFASLQQYINIDCTRMIEIHNRFLIFRWGGVY